MQHENSILRPSFPLSLPVLGHLFRTCHQRKTASKACGGNPVAARSLARQYCQCPDGTTERLLRSLLEGKIPPDIKDALCREVLEHHDDLLCSLLRDYHVVPSEMKRRALFLFATGSLSEYRALDTIPGHPILREMYSSASKPVRELVCSAAVRYNAEAELADALVSPGIPDSIGTLCRSEWEVVVAGLISSSRHSLLYRLLLDAPIPYAVHAIRALHGSGWNPENASLRGLWERVLGAVPVGWTYPEMSGDRKQVLESPSSRTRFLVFSPDGSLLAVTGYDGTTRVWDVARGEPVLSCNPKGVSCCPVFSADGRCLLTLIDGTLTAWSISDGNILFAIPDCGREHCTIAISRDGCLVAFPCAAGGLAIASLVDGGIICTKDTGDIEVTALSFSPDCKSVVCGLQDGTIRLIAISDGDVIWKSERHVGKIGLVSFRHDGSGIIAVAEKAYPFLLDEKTGSCIRVFTIPSHKPKGCAISTDGRWVFVIGTDDTIRIFGVGEDLPMGYIPARKGGVGSAAFFADNQMAVTGGINGIVRIFRFDSDSPERMFKAHDGWIRSLAVSPDGTVLASAGWDGMVKLWRLPVGRLLRSLDARGGALTCLAASRDGRILAAGTSEGLVRLWHLPGAEYFSTMDAFTGSVCAIAVNDNGTLIATAGPDATVRIWELPSGSLVSTLTGLKNRSYCLAFTPDSKGVFAGGWDNKVRLFHLSDGNLIRAFTGHTNIITSIAVKQDGTGFVSGSYDGTCRIWDLAKDNSYLSCVGNRAEIDTVAISPDGAIIVAADRAGKIHVISAEDGACSCSLTGAPSRVTGLVIAPGNDLLVTSSDEGSISYFSLRQQSHVRNFSAHAGKICGLAVAGMGTHIASAGDDEVVQLLPLPLTTPLSSLTPASVAIAEREAHGHPHRPERDQWNFIAALLALKCLHEICICSPPPAVDAHEIMIMR